MKVIKVVDKAIFLLPLFLIFFIIILPLCKPGLIVGGDWVFPYTNEQLRIFGEGPLFIWSNQEIPTGSQILHKNIYPFSLLAKVVASIGLSGIFFQKATLFLTIFGIYWFSYLLFYRLTKNKPASVVGALSYLFSPLVFNYLNMGWNLVLIFLALAPIFILIATDYFKKGGVRRVITLGYICALGFMQSQVIVWFPIIYTLVFLYQVKPVNLLKQIIKFFIGIATMIVTVLIVHAPWIVTSLYYMNTSFKTTSNYDVTRFSEATSLLNSFRGWGSLFNQQFEFAYPPILVLFSLFPIILIIYSATTNKTHKLQKLYYFAITLILVAPIVFLFREHIAKFPFSSIIRDSSRFLVITSLGLSLGIALSLSVIKNKKIFLSVVIALILYAYPFYSGKTYSTFNDAADVNEYMGRDFRLRLLDIPMSDSKNGLAKYSDQVNLFLPSGGGIGTKSNVRFQEAFWEMSDMQANFSPYANGIYSSDKSDPLIANFTQALHHSKNNMLYVKKLLGVYGVNNIFNRNNLKSLISISPDQKDFESFCHSVDNQSSDWSVTEICHIENAYPIVYSSVLPIYSSDSISDIIGESDLSGDHISIIGCPEALKMTDLACGPTTPYVLAENNPVIDTTRLSSSKYVVNISQITGPFILVFNQTYHPGWRVINEGREIQNLSHLLINQLVNGWVIHPLSDQTTIEYVIEFHPQKIYSQLFPISALIFLILSLYVLVGVIMKK